MLWLLLKVRLLGLWNTVRHSDRRRRALGVGLGVLGVALSLVVYYGFRGFLWLLRAHTSPEEVAYEVFYFLFLFLLAGALPFVASTLLHSSDHLLLGTAPISPRAVVAAKLVEATVSNSLQFVIIGVPALWACATVMGLTPQFWPMMAAIVLLFATLPALLTALLLLMGLAAFGARRVRGAIAAANAIMATAVCLTMVVQADHLPVRPSLQSLMMPEAGGPSLVAHYGPSSWFAHALICFAHGDAYGGWLEAVRLTAVIGLLFALCLVVGSRMLTGPSLAEGAEDSAPLMVDTGPVRSSHSGFLLVFTSPVAALVAKDLRYVMRDSVLLSQLGMPVILFFVPFVLALQGSRTLVGSEGDLYPFAAAMTAVIVFMQTSVLSLTSVGLESRSFWLVLSSPNGGRTVLWAKFFMSTIVSGGAGVFLTLVGAIAFRAPWPLAALQAVALALSAMALCGMGVGISASLPRFVYDNPAHRVSLWALILGFVGTTGYLMVTAILAALVYFVAQASVGPSGLVYAVGVCLFLLVAAVSAFVPMLVGARRIDAYQWEH